MRHPTLDALLTTSVPTRRTVIGGLLGLVALGVVSTVGCEDEGVSAALAGITDDSDTGSDVILAHEAAVSDDDATYFVDFTPVPSCAATLEPTRVKPSTQMVA